MRRSRMSRRSSRRQFRRGAGVHPKNDWTHYNMRGGIRL